MPDRTVTWARSECGKQGTGAACHARGNLLSSSVRFLAPSVYVARDLPERSIRFLAPSLAPALPRWAARVVLDALFFPHDALHNAMCRNSQIYRYRVDADDRLVWVDEWWLAFARENGAPELSREGVLGRLLWDFVTGDPTSRLYCEIHARVRSSGKSVILPFRCDSPSLQRHMRLTITREDAGQLLYESVLLRVEPQRRQQASDPWQPLAEGCLTMCSFCKRALMESRGWLDVEDVSARMRLFDTKQVAELKYIVCPECARIAAAAPDNGNAA